MKQIIRNLLPSIIFASKEKLPIIVDIVIKDLHYIILQRNSPKNLPMFYRSRILMHNEVTINLH